MTIVDIDLTKAPYKPINQSINQPTNQPTKRPKDAPELKEIFPEELEPILEEHKKWLGSERKEGRQANLILANLQVAVLLFDEADALLGKRSEVKDAHDGYANIEVSYLLSKVEANRGLVIFTTNRKVGVGSKLVCRVKDLLEFSPPVPSSLSQARQ